MKPVPIENLLIHADFVRDLARALAQDPHERADLEQEAWLQAMRRPPEQANSLRGWLASLVHSLWRNRARDDQRRRRRELAVEPPPEGDPVDVLVQREQVRQRLLDAVLRLPEPFRAAVLLRYYEELSPAQIAERLGVPAATVRTRVARGLERLRVELDSDHGGERAAWAVPLLSFSAAAAPTPLALAVTFLMKKVVAVASAALLAVASFVLAWSVWFSPPSQPSSSTDAASGSPAVASGDATLQSSSTQVEPESAPRTAAAAVDSTADHPEVAEALSGELLVEVVWADGTPAAGIRVHVGVREAGRRPLGISVTDEEGRVRMRVAAGKVRVTTDRRSQEVEGEVAAGVPCRLRVPLDAGIDVVGVVRDARGGAVPGASVWITSFQAPWCAMAAVATSDRDGRFEVRAAEAMQSLGATAPGHAPSKLVDLELLDQKQSPVQIELQLGDGGAVVAGRVVDTDGRPVGGASIAIGSNRNLVDSGVDGRMIETWAPRQVRSDADGRFRCEGLAAATHPVEVWANGFPFWHGSVVAIAGETAKLDIALARGAVVHGVVTGEDGAPLAAAVVRAFPEPIDESFLMMGQYDYDSTFGYPSAVADENGRYRLTGVAPGEVQLYAGPAAARRRMSEVVPWAHAVVPIAAGATLEWNAEVVPGPTIRGVVRYRDGAPMPDSFVNLMRPGGQRGSAVVTDREGRFCFLHLERLGYDLSVQVWDPPKDAPPIEARDVWPDRGELELVAAYDAPKQLAKGSVKGRVLDAGGRCPNPAALRVVLVSDDRSWNPHGPLKDGAFSFEDVGPGRKRVIVMNNEDPILVGEPFELQPAEAKDLGVLTTQPGGRLRLVIVREPGTESVEPTIHLRPVESMHSRKVAIGTAKELELDNLCLGDHVISGWHRDLASIGAAARVVEGATAECTITLRRAVLREMVIEYEAEQRLTKIEVVDEQGAVAWDYEVAQAKERPLRAKVNLPLGTYALRVRTATGVAETAFSIVSHEPEQAPVVLHAR